MFEHREGVPLLHFQEVFKGKRGLYQKGLRELGGKEAERPRLLGNHAVCFQTDVYFESFPWSDHEVCAVLNSKAKARAALVLYGEPLHVHCHRTNVLGHQNATVVASHAFFSLRILVEQITLP